MVGPQLPHSVSALACKGDLTFAAAGPTIHEARRAHTSGAYVGGHRGGVLQLLVLGTELLSLGRDGRLLVWRIGQYGAPHVAIDLAAAAASAPGRGGAGAGADGGAPFVPRCMAHPDTYINKVVVGGADGRLLLLNFMTGQPGSPVACVAPSPALDVVGVGLADGRVVLHNLRYDEQVLALSNAAAAGTAAARFLAGSAAAAAAAAASVAVTALSFRTGQGLPLLAVGGAAGLVALWNLEGRCLHAVLRDAHDAALLGLHFFAGEPRLMSSAADNSIKQWVLDGPEAVPRLLKFRSGHSAPPTVVRHYAEGLRLLSAGADRSFRVFSTIQDQQSRELSQRKTAARAKKLRVEEADIKLPRVVALAACEARERDWANVVTCHAGDPAAYTWRLAHFTLGEHALLPPPEDDGGPPPAPASAVAVSCCGNFALVGSEAGRVDRYNLQSGQHRGGYARRGADGGHLPAHDGAVVGLGSDSVNALLVTAGADGALLTWDFRKQAPAGALALGAPAARLALHAGSGLAAVALDDHRLVLVDIEACRVVRRFAGHTDRVTDLAISADCRWLLTSSMDASLRVWDIPASQCLQVMHMGSPVTSLSLAAAGDLLAAAHAGKRGVFLYSNQVMFGDPSSVATYGSEAVPVHLPSIAAGGAASRPRGAGGGGGGGGGGGARRVAVAARRAGAPRGGGGGSSSSSDEESEEDEVASEGSELRPHREVRLLVDGGLAGGDDDEDGGSGGSSSSDFYESSSDEGGSGSGSDTDESGGSGADGAEGGAEGGRRKRRRAARRAAAAAAAAEAAAAAAAYRRTDASGAPAPLAPHLATLSLLPRAQWENLLHLDTIKARSKPLQPPKKPEAAPFFLPTVPGLAGQPTFAAGGGGEQEAERGGGSGSRVLRARDGASAAAAASPFVALLRACGAAGDYASFVAHVRGLTPAAVDRELRAMAVLEGAAGDADQEVADVGLLLDALGAELDAGRNFDLAQALLSCALVVHAEALTRHAPLLDAATRLGRKLRATWLRLEGLLQSVRCMADFVGNVQG
ncbi:WDR36 [Scenedesmus sp. PABB004]|nr:WDR36 [Scenedesmus sp. PABB004]